MLANSPNVDQKTTFNQWMEELVMTEETLKSSRGPVYLKSLKNKGDILSEGISDLLVIETNLIVFSTFS